MWPPAWASPPLVPTFPVPPTLCIANSAHLQVVCMFFMQVALRMDLSLSSLSQCVIAALILPRLCAAPGPVINVFDVHGCNRQPASQPAAAPGCCPPLRFAAAGVPPAARLLFAFVCLQSEMSDQRTQTPGEPAGLPARIASNMCAQCKRTTNAQRPRI